LEIFGKNPRWRRYLSKLRKLGFGLKFSKTEIFQKFLQPSIQTNHGRTFFEIIQNGGVNQDGGFLADLFLKNCSKSTVIFFQTSNGFIFRKD
jgi:hypothetical protein